MNHLPLLQQARALFAERSQPFKHALEALAARGRRTVVLQNLGGGALPFVIAALVEKRPSPVLVLTAGLERSEDLVNDLEFSGVADAHHYPKWEVLPYDEDELNAEGTAKSLDVFEALSRARSGAAKAPVVVAPVDALLQRILPAQELARLTVSLEWGERIEPAELAKRLEAAGYAREAIVESRGEFALRGNILDVFPVNAEDPWRIDFFGDEIEQIRVFEVDTQRSKSTLGTDARILLPPARLKGAAEAHLRAGGRLGTLLDLFPPDTLVLLDAPERHDEQCAFFERAVERQYHEVLHESAELPAPGRLVLSRAELLRELERFHRAEHSELPIETLDKTVARIPFETRFVQPAAPEVDAWLSTFRKLREADTQLFVVCDNDGQVQRLEELLRAKDIPARAIYETTKPEALPRLGALRGTREVVVLTGRLAAGFHFPDALLAFVTDREMFGRYKRRHVYKKIYKGKPIASAGEIRRGDYVVHVEHGIGRFLGMRTQSIDGRAVDLIELKYADENKLLVPVEKIRMVQKYSGTDGAEPALDRLGSGKWAKRRSKSSAEVEKVAEQLLHLYAKREAARRKPYPPDTPLMREFETSFLYPETPDQAAAIAAVKEDLEGPRPMDRLVCGDVGFGKTEVAIRAVFKCVTGGRQSAILCPTTILAQQHYLNMKERFADFPVRIDVVSRFRTAKEVKEILAKLKTGEIDVVVGTHRLLGKEVKFLDLGLVVVDEEHRFGVKHKERLKELRADVDFMTLSATPIPRTLQFALSGLRELSLITTPPPDRQPIKTKLIQFEEAQVAEAILRELNRGGQVYFLHNRVATIQEVAKRLNEIVPHARVAVAHGQMDEGDLEDVMLAFVDRDFDILVATTIIESGLDIPNCNTIIINRADTLGLSQLYQLRGRVGREKRRAYAYLIVPQGEGITDAAVKRLAAIEEFTELGSGFQVAMRDMEIRGTGNLLGLEQHGTINDIGFELYCEMLKDAVSSLRGEDIPEDRDVEIKAELSSVIPAPYIPVETQRLTFYKRLAAAREEADVAAAEAELRDRYGEAPEPVRALLLATRLRIAGQRLGLSSIRQGAAIVRISWYAPEAAKWLPDFEKATAPASSGFRAAKVDSRDTLALTAAPGSAPYAVLERLLPLLLGMSLE
ncbi:MAG: transcription-repair coupling factor [Candidatus Sumerlaeia bacterium]|nr:transcription-repair coupling factor [Candidatus Sumerlaeia bacterium]